MSARAARGRGHGRGRSSTLAGPSSSGHMPVANAPAMLCVLERVVGASTGNGIRGSIFERLWANGTEIFRGVSGVAPNVAEYWLEATERIMNDLDYSVEQKLKGAISLLRDEAYQWWLTVRDRTPVNRVTWELFKMVFKGKYVGASYVDARRKEFLNLVQGGKTVAEYEAEFLRLSRYAVGIVATEYECSVRFEDGFRDELRVLITLQRERDFAALVEKAKIAEEVKRTERQNHEKDRNRFWRDSEPSGGANRSAKRARVEEPVRVVPINFVRPQVCGDCGKVQVAEWRVAQPVRDGPQPPRGHGEGRGCNGNGRGRGVPDRGVGNAEARQPALVYTARR
ncbi:uncharacterized protein [Gossypium hirsutum]|uniref:Retrotransposon gag domain-containing protein n=1 Tax=Gossypium hirsutum TaxID=3635 RepID=A0A1U8KXQ5_GOSHI|nr:uncharacterized protein LOC107921927 [Gossypium hirsutum]